ncbi:hypothetical protein Dsin_031449 [Dipteronia sinensis]|uniref:Reverse transcriptase zinc-binding domain-containing protein n=1 Tax=Dipteronia sinensis TaxID=43782 RepID=A0AAD9ZL84_9ROSI|nr:hypothetical protein Dsin_031449 [Dipteronia sinensis]
MVLVGSGRSFLEDLCSIENLNNGIVYIKNISDNVAWSFSPNGSFTVWSFRRRLEDFCSVVSPFSSLIWHGMCPPKVEILVWQILKGRVMVKEVLSRFGVTFAGNQLCPLCNSVVELCGVSCVLLREATKCGALCLWQLFGPFGRHAIKLFSKKKS